MATSSESIIFEQRPIQEWLANFRRLFTTKQKDLSISVSSDPIQAIFSTASNEVGKGLLLQLLSALQIQPTAQLLPSQVGDGTLLNDLYTLQSCIFLNQCDIASAIPLVKQLVDNKGDAIVCNDVKIWHAVFDLVAQTNKSLARTKTPLSPPVLNQAVLDEPLFSVARLLQLFKDHQQGRLQGRQETWIEIRLQPGDYKEVGRQLKKNRDLLGYVLDCIHFDYNPKTLVFVIRMPTSVHEGLIQFLGSEIMGQLRKIRDTTHGSAALLLGKIESMGSTSIHLDDGVRHDPDAQFRHEDACYPGVVIEVANTQQKKNLPRLADDYIVQSSGSIKMVIGIKVEQDKSKRATVSVWCPKFIKDQDGEYLVSEETVRSEAFRTEDGAHVTGNTLQIQLNHFIPSPIAINSEALHQKIVISYEKIADFLYKAEVFSKTSEQGIKAQLRPGVEKRMRESTPPDELGSEDEERFQREESEESTRANEEDRDWGGH